MRARASQELPGAQRWLVLGAALASLPITSLMAFVWLYWDTGDAMRVANLAVAILWLVLASLIFFIALPLLIKAGWAFWPSLFVSLILTTTGYMVAAAVLERFGTGD